MREQKRTYDIVFKGEGGIDRISRVKEGLLPVIGEVVVGIDRDGYPKRYEVKEILPVNINRDYPVVVAVDCDVS